MLNRNQSSNRFAAAVAAGLTVSILIVVAALVQASTTVQGFL